MSRILIITGAGGPGARLQRLIDALRAEGAEVDVRPTYDAPQPPAPTLAIIDEGPTIEKARRDFAIRAGLITGV